MDGFGEFSSRNLWWWLGRRVASGMRGIWDGAGRKKRQAQREGRAGEDGEGFDEDVGHGLGVCQVRIELVSVTVIISR